MGVGREEEKVSGVVTVDRELHRSGVEAGVRRPRLGVLASNRPCRWESAGGVLPDRSWLLECFDCSLGMGALVEGMTRGVSFLEDSNESVASSSCISSRTMFRSGVLIVALRMCSIGP